MEQAELETVVSHIEAQEWDAIRPYSARFLNYVRMEVKAQRELDIRILRAALALLQSGVRAVEGRTSTSKSKTSRTSSGPKKKTAAELLSEI